MGNVLKIFIHKIRNIFAVVFDEPIISIFIYYNNNSWKMLKIPIKFKSWIPFFVQSLNSIHIVFTQLFSVVGSAAPTKHNSNWSIRMI